MTLDDVGRLMAFLRDRPPLRVMVAAYLGIKPPEAAPPQRHLTADDMKRLMAATGGRIPGIGGLHG